MNATDDFSRLYSRFLSEIDNGISSRVYRFNKLAGAISYKESIKYGRMLRDEWLHTYAILPGAVITFCDLASSREWIVIGKPSKAARLVETLNSSFAYDRYGIKHYGFEQLIGKLCMDWLCIGRAMFHSDTVDNGNNWSPLEYIDPGYTIIHHEDDKVYWLHNIGSGFAPRKLEQNKIFFMDSSHIGASGVVVGRVAYLLPMANMDWLLRQHDSMQLDGRKIRELFIVQEGMYESLVEGMKTLMALTIGGDPTKNNLPVVEVDAPVGTKISDLFARMGISEIPREFNRSDMEARYVREISATLGLPIGQFWHDPRGTNRSLEQVTQERSTLKGPSYFVRSLGRLINNSPISGKRPGNRAIIQFDEETDNSSMKLKAEAMFTYAKAVQTIQEIYKNSGKMLDFEQWSGFFERQGLMPPNTTLKDVATMEEMTLQRSLDEFVESGIVGLSKEGYVTERYANIMPGEVRMDKNGKVIEKRADFSISINRSEE